jgi:RHS repeat-associated protein
VWTRNARSRGSQLALVRGRVAWLAVTLAAVAAIGPVDAATAAPEGAIRYVYDDSGRLKAVVDPATETGIYTWDVVGNLLSVSRESSASVQVLQMSPGRGPVGSSVRITGTGFSSTASENSVSFNGTSAVVTSASSSVLRATVPVGASTGPVTVTAPQGSATSDVPFTVAASGAPAISSIAPSLATPGTAVTVTGHDFGAELLDNDVGVNALRAEVTTASATTIDMVVPAATGSGPVSVTTPDGSATGPDLFIPPAGVAPGDVAFTGRMSVGETRTVALATSGKVGMLVFDGAAGQRVSLAPTASSFGGGYCVSILGTGNAALKSVCNGFLEPVTLPTAGTYSILIDPSGAATGSLTFKLWDVPADSNHNATPSTQGDTKVVTSTAPGQNGKVTFSGTQGQRISLTMSHSYSPSPPAFVSVKRPDGTTLVNPSDGAYIEAFWLPSTGTYTILVDPRTTTTGNTTVTLWDVPADASASLAPSPTGGSTTASTTVPGQEMAITFSALAGQRLVVYVNAETLPSWSGLSLRSPNGTSLPAGTNNLSTGFTSSLVTAPMDGTYTIFIDVEWSGTGSIGLTVYEVPPDATVSITPTPGGAQVTGTTTFSGQLARITWSGTAGQRISFNVTAESYPNWAYVSVLKPDGSTLFQHGNITSLPDFRDIFALPTDGTYTVLVDPPGISTGDLTMTMYDVPPDFADTIAFDPDGDGKTVTLPTPGQNGRLTFTATQGQQASLAITALNPLGGRVSLQRPDGTNLISPTSRTGPYTFPTVTLPTTGTYTISVDPVRAATGSITLSLTDVSSPSLASAAARSGARSAALRDPFEALVARNQVGGEAAGGAAPPQPDTAVRAPQLGGLDLRRPGGPLLRTRDGRALRGLHFDRVSGRRFPVKPERAAKLSEPVLTATSTARPAQRERRDEGTRGGVHSSPAATQRRRARAARTPRTGRSLRRFEPQGSLIWRPQRDDRRGTWLARKPATPWGSLPALEAPDGLTALAGQALRLDGTPLRGVSVRLEHGRDSARTDGSGRFVLREPTSGHHVLIVDGKSVARQGARYGTFEIGVDLARGRTTKLDYPIWMTALDRAGDALVDSPTKGETVLRTPRIPGLEVRIPAGSVIRDRDGRMVRHLNLTQVPVDRPPFPLPKFIQVPTYFTVQPGGAYLSKGARIIYPNYQNLPSGQRATFWSYDPDQRGWHVYGRGTVTADGEQVVPDPGVRVWEFTGAMIGGGSGGPTSGPTGGGPTGGDPVDLASGLFLYEKTDLTLPDVVPIDLRRTYRPGDPTSYAFGIGTNHPYDLRLWSVNNYRDATLILPDGSKVFYQRTSPGHGYLDAVYEAQRTPGPFYKSKITWNGNLGWDLRLTDGTVYVFPEFAPLGAIRDRFGNTLRIARDSGQRITQITSPNRRWMRFTYDGSNRITQARDNGGRTTSYTYDTSGRLASATDVAGGVTTYTYNAANQMTAIEDPRGITYLRNSYDGNGRVSEQTLANAGTYQFDYTLAPDGKVTKTDVTNPLGNINEYTFNPAGYQTSETQAADTALERTTTYEREAGTNLLLSTTDQLNRTTRYEYDPTGNLVETTELADTPDAVTTAYAYEPVFNQLTSITDPLQHVTEFGYDARGQLTSTRDATGRETTLAYADNDGRATTITDPAGNATQLDWIQGDLSSVRDPLGHITSYLTDSIGRLRSVTNPLGQRTRYDYNPHNQPTQITDPDGHSTTLTYDPNGNLTELTDARGNTTTATYDSMDHIESWTDPLGKTETYLYDDDGNLTELADRKGNLTTYRYDELGRRVFAGFKTAGTPGAPTYESTISYTYDAGDRITRADDSNSGTFHQSYDGLDRITEQTSPQGAVTYSYDAASRRATMTAPDQAPASYSYDDANRLTGVSRGGQGITIAHDAAGRRNSLLLPNGLSQSYSYDDASRLTGITYKHDAATLGDLSYEYDAAGRLAATWGSYARTNLPAAMFATYDDANRRITQDGRTLTYDDNGNLTRDAAVPQNTYGWDARNQLDSISGGLSAGFTYDPFGRRTSRTVAGQTRGYVYDGHNVVQELTGGSPSANLLTGLALDETYVRATPSGTANYLTDALGSTIALADPFGMPTTAYTYDPFGNTSTSGPTSDNPYQYTGRANDGTGLYYYRARYYDPTMARFISEDPIGIGGGDVNLYAYVWNSPLNWTDPSGLSPMPPIPPGFDNEGFEPRGPDGAVFRPDPTGGETWHPHPDSEEHGQHWDYRKRPYDGWRHYPDGRWEARGRNPGPKPGPRPGGGAGGGGGTGVPAPGGTGGGAGGGTAGRASH